MSQKTEKGWLISQRQLICQDLGSGKALLLSSKVQTPYPIIFLQQETGRMQKKKLFPNSSCLKEGFDLVLYWTLIPPSTNSEQNQYPPGSAYARGGEGSPRTGHHLCGHDPSGRYHQRRALTCSSSELPLHFTATEQQPEYWKDRKHWGRWGNPAMERLRGRTEDPDKTTCIFIHLQVAPIKDREWLLAAS